MQFYFFFFSSRRRHTRLQGDWSSDVCSSDGVVVVAAPARNRHGQPPGDVEVRAHRGAEATEAVLEMQEPDLDHRGGLVGDRTNVHVLAVTGSPHDLDGDVTQLLQVVADVDTEQPGGAQQALK